MYIFFFYQLTSRSKAISLINVWKVKTTFSIVTAKQSAFQDQKNRIKIEVWPIYPPDDFTNQELISTTLTAFSAIYMVATLIPLKLEHNLWLSIRCALTWILSICFFEQYYLFASFQNRRAVFYPLQSGLDFYWVLRDRCLILLASLSVRI